MEPSGEFADKGMWQPSCSSGLQNEVSTILSPGQDAQNMGKVLPEVGNGRDAAITRESSQFPFVEGVSVCMRAVEAVIKELAQSNVPVLLLAERGAGKHSIARRIHDTSHRSTQPFRAISCATLESEKLGKGAAGKDELFNKGTVFLEELADLSANCQERLLDALPKAGDTGASLGKGARLICGSARDLELEVKARRLREDLYYRISGVCLRLPPLRQRREDIPLLMNYFLRKYARDFGRSVPTLSAETLHLFQDYSWPGNLRELEDAAKALVALGDESIAMGGLRALLRKHDPGGNGGPVSLKQAARAASREAEKELILKALTRTRWNRRRAAQELQISYKALLYKLKQIGYESYEAF
jgi:two-component system response regulator AtoC